MCWWNWYSLYTRKYWNDYSSAELRCKFQNKVCDAFYTCTFLAQLNTRQLTLGKMEPDFLEKTTSDRYFDMLEAFVNVELQQMNQCNT